VLVVAFAVLLIVQPATASPAQNTATASYRIREGDTLWSLSRRFGTSPERLAALNGMPVDATLSIGRAIRVPAVERPEAATAAGTRRLTVATPTTTHRIRPGDTLWSLARRYGTKPERIAAMNGITLTTTLALNRELKVPGAPAATAAAPRGARSPDPAAVAAAREANRRRLVALPSRGETWTTELLALSRRQIGVRYRWGGTSPAGFDCSGLIYYTFARQGVALPRTTYDMYDAGVPVPRDELQAGDIVFFQTLRPGPSHAGIYLGDGRFIHASRGGRGVRITPMDDDYYATRFLGARRF
jgi:cell wall-associated NlpC family hydrolase